MLTALPYDISLSNSDTEVFSPKCIHQYSSLPSWWLSFTNESVFIPGCTRMQTTFSFQTVLFCTVQHVFLLRRHCAPPSWFVTNGELMVHEIYPKQNRRVTEALEGCTASHGRWSIDMKKGTCMCLSSLTSIHPCSPLIILLGSHYQPSYLNWSIEYCRTLFPRLLSARLFWLLSLFLLSNREILITQYVNLTRFNPLLTAPNLSLHTDYASISHLLNYFTSQLLTEQI